MGILSWVNMALGYGQPEPTEVITAEAPKHLTISDEVKRLGESLLVLDDWVEDIDSGWGINYKPYTQTFRHVRKNLNICFKWQVGEVMYGRVGPSENPRCTADWMTPQEKAYMLLIRDKREALLKQRRAEEADQRRNEERLRVAALLDMERTNG